MTTPLKTRLNILNVKLDKALGRKGPRIPGDGDGDGIANEGRKKGPRAASRAKPAATPAAGPKGGAKAMTFMQILNDKEGRRMVEGIEDTVSSLRDKTGDKILGNVLRTQVKQLEQKFGYKYDASDVLRNN